MTVMDMGKQVPGEGAAGGSGRTAHEPAHVARNTGLDTTCKRILEALLLLRLQLHQPPLCLASGAPHPCPCSIRPPPPPHSPLHSPPHSSPPTARSPPNVSPPLPTSPGGRSSTRRAVSGGVQYQFDHGAQFFRASSPAMQQLVRQWMDAGGAAEQWAGGAGGV